MKQTLIALICATLLLTAGGCVTDNGKYPMPTANFTPKRVYAVQYDKLWQATLDALDENRITVVSTDKASGIIQTDYIAGPGTFMVIMAQSTRYKYNITLRNEPDGGVRVNVVCRIEDSIDSGQGSSQWRDVTPQNVALENKLETWLYEQLEDGLKAS